MPRKNERKKIKTAQPHPFSTIAASANLIERSVDPNKSKVDKEEWHP
ncbi:MAG: hypothetical protein GX062_00980 [Firmicutes bacterium]|mgnify:CR=1 FL=1|nr:hypothetical protein [Bacillota bacterium]